MISQRYTRNIPAISEEQQYALSGKCVCILGCGGLGGYVTEALARMGVGHIRLIDADRFSESNLNRQLYATEKTVKQTERKAEAAARRVQEINSLVRTEVFTEMLTEENAENLLCGVDLVVDALDNIPARLLAEKTCAKLGLWLVHGAVEGWMAQICTAAPGSDILAGLYAGETSAHECKAEPPAEKPISVLPQTAMFAASVQASEAVSLLIEGESPLSGKLLLADLKDCIFQSVEL